MSTPLSLKDYNPHFQLLFVAFVLFVSLSQQNAHFAVSAVHLKFSDLSRMSGERSSKTTSQNSWEADDDGGMVNPSGPQEPVIHREDEIEEQQDEQEDEEEDFEEEEDDEVSRTQSQPVGVEEVQVTSPDESRCLHCCHKVLRGIRGNRQVVSHLSLFYLILLRIEADGKLENYE